MKTPVRTWNPRNLWPHYENKNPDSPLHELQAGRSGGNETPIHRQNANSRPSHPDLPAGGGAGHGAGQLRCFRRHCLCGEQPRRYRAASPLALLPLGVRQLIIHGTADDTVPIEIARRYAEAARAAGDPVRLVELPGAGHMEFLDPHSLAHATLCGWLAEFSGDHR